ncbi:MAG: hypothetical protein AAFY59_03810 [Pseudomonadota bacterium]
MTGRFIAVVGPSGVGKDSVMAGMAARTGQLKLVRRVITRPRMRAARILRASVKRSF